jgi:hypothetical protein
MGARRRRDFGFWFTAARNAKFEMCNLELEMWNYREACDENFGGDFVSAFWFQLFRIFLLQISPVAEVAEGVSSSMFTFGA